MVSDGGKIVAIAAATNYMSSVISFRVAALSVLGGMVAASSASFFVVIKSDILIFALIGLGGCGIFFLKKRVLFYRISIFLFYLGLVLFGMHEMKDSFAFISQNHWVREYLVNQQNLLIFVVNGVLLCLVLQSGGAVTFLAVALQRSGLLNFDQTIFFLLGSNLGSAFRGQFIVLLYAVTSTVANAIVSIALIPFIPKFKALYEKMFPAKNNNLNIEAKFIKSLPSRPVGQWQKMLQEEYKYLILSFSDKFFNLLNTDKKSYIEAYYTSMNNIITQIKAFYLDILSLGKDKYSDNINYGFERVLYIEKINEALHQYIELYRQLKDDNQSVKILDSSSQHIHFILGMLHEYIEKTSTDDIEVLQSTINSYTSNRRMYLSTNLITVQNNLSLDAKIKFILCYNEILSSADMLLETYKENKCV